VLVTTVAAAGPVPGPDARADLARIVSAIPDGETVLIDGLVASPAAAPLLPHTGRIRMTVLLHMPLATVLDAHPDASSERSERVVLRAAAGVVVTSEWTRQQVLTRYAIPAHRVHVARPGVDRVAASARPVHGRLICVGVLGRHKGQDLLVEALADLAERDWHCVLAAALADWLGDKRHRYRLRAAARQRRSTLRGWEQTTQEIANALTAHGCRKPVPPGVDNHPEKTSGPA
jgi:glycosyltransferase involved in cell wall biosynthesis